MAKESRYDSYELIPPDCGLWENRSYVDDSIEHFISCTNMWLTDKKTLRTRPGFSLKQADTIVGKRVRKIWAYETFSPASTTVLSYLICAAQDVVTDLYSLYWMPAGGVTWNLVNSLRGCNSGQRCPMLTISRGLAYVKTFPGSLVDVLGTIVLDGTSGSIYTKPWGLLGPENPAQISGVISHLTADIEVATVTLNVPDTSIFPAAPFPVWVGEEQMNVTAKPTATTLTVTRAYGATIASKHRDGELVRYLDWGASDHQVTTKYGWTYSYAYKSITGAISNRAPVEPNPDLLPSFTGPFLDLVPKITLTGHADTTNVPTIQIYRTTDGGGESFYLLEEIDNPGAGPFTYYDDSFGTGPTTSTYNDPVPDDKIDTATGTPTLVSNSPPPTVVPPSVIGSDPIQLNSFAMTNHVRRIFFSVGNYLYYSSYEELLCGIPEEEFATDLAAGGANYMAFNDVIVALASDNESLWIFTTKNTYRLFGSTKDSFYVTKVFDTGARVTELNAAAASSNGQIAFIANSGAVYMISDNGASLNRISDPMPLTGGQAITTGSAYASLYFYKTANQEFLFLASSSFPSVVSSEIYLYDVGLSKERRKPVWLSRWSLAGNVSAFGAFEGYSSLVTGVFVSLCTLSESIVTQLRESTLVAPTDLQVNGSSSSYSSGILSMPIRIPPGNHVNTFNRPTRDVKSTRIVVYTFPASPGLYSAPLVSYVQDANGGAIQREPQDPPRIQYTSGGLYEIRVYPIDKDCYRIIAQILGNPGEYLDIYGFVVEFEPHNTATTV